MATNLLPFRSSVIITAAIPDAGKVSENSRRGTSSSGNWWGPLFAVSSEPDYIDSNAAVSQSSEKKSTQRFAPGSFTDEKAKRLRMLTKDSAFHDVMYHSAIASRLASEFKDRSDV